MFVGFIIVLAILVVLCFVGANMIAPAPGAALLGIVGTVLVIVDIIAVLFWLFGWVSGHIHISYG